MSTELTWRASLTTSYLHAAVAIDQGKVLADQALAAALAEPVRNLAEETAAAGIDPGRFLERTAALAVDVEGTHRLVEMAVTKTAGRDAAGGSVERIAGRMVQLESQFLKTHPDALDELSLRSGPLRLAWEAVGSGILRLTGLLTEPDVIVSRAVVAVVHPALGGAGAAHLENNSVRIEGVLAHPHEDLPESLRLAWLIAQLQLDVPLYSETLAADRRARVAALAMVPPVLSAAAELGLAGCEPIVIERALEVWYPVEPTSPPVSDRLVEWWQTYQQSRPSLAVALAALDRMLAELTTVG